MAIFTPRGLKIRLSIQYTFALMARLFPRFDAFRILQKTEAVENLTLMASMIAGIIAFALCYNYMQIAIIVIVTNLIFNLQNNYGLFIPPFKQLLRLSHFYSAYIAGYGIIEIGIIIFGYFKVGWKGVLSYLIAMFITLILELIIDFSIFRKNIKYMV